MNDPAVIAAGQPLLMAHQVRAFELWCWLNERAVHGTVKVGLADVSAATGFAPTLVFRYLRRIEAAGLIGYRGGRGKGHVGTATIVMGPNATTGGTS